MSIPSVQFVDAWYGYARRLSCEDGMVLPNRLLVIDEQSRADAHNDGVPAEILVACGQPALEKIPALAPTENRATLFVGAPVERDYGQRLGYTEAECWTCVQKAAALRPDLITELYYAPHPEQILGDNVSSSQILKYSFNLLETQIGQLVGIFSSPLTDAFLAGRRSVSVQPNAQGTDMWALSKTGRARRARTVTELIELLQSSPQGGGDTLRAQLKNSAERVTHVVQTILVAH